MRNTVAAITGTWPLAADVKRTAPVFETFEIVGADEDWQATGVLSPRDGMPLPELLLELELELLLELLLDEEEDDETLPPDGTLLPAPPPPPPPQAPSPSTPKAADRV